MKNIRREYNPDKVPESLKQAMDIEEEQGRGWFVLPRICVVMVAWGFYAWMLFPVFAWWAIAISFVLVSIVLILTSIIFGD